jgi:hypothetical protein
MCEAKSAKTCAAQFKDQQLLESYDDWDFKIDLEEIQNQLNIFDKLKEKLKNVEHKLKDFISKYGPKAVEFIKCMVS